MIAESRSDLSHDQDMADLLAILRRSSSTLLASSIRITDTILADAPAPVRDHLARYLDWSALVYALPITEQSLWIWHRFDDRRYVFANHILERAADDIGHYLSAKDIAFVDLARRYAGKISLVELAARSGLGARGINNLLLHPRFGSWIQLHAILIDCRLDGHDASSVDVCVKCGLCVEACPAEAIRGKKFFPERCSRLVASPWLPQSRAIAVTANSYIECAECISSCPIGKQPEGLFSWKR